MTATSIDTDAMRALLHARFPAGQYAVLEEVRNATGFHASRSCDALVMGLWPSRGLELWGVEIKVSRADWLRELKNPKKAEELAARCDRWYVAVPSADIVGDELPAAWGLMVPRGKQLVIGKQAEKLTPTPIDRPFLAALLRRAQETGATAQQVRQAKEATETEVRQRYEREIQGSRNALADLEKAVEKFRSESGVEIDSWNAGRIGEAVRIVLARQHGHAQRQLEDLHRSAQRIVDTVARELADLAAEDAA